MASPLQVESDLKLLDDVDRKVEENFSYAMQLVYSSVLPMSLHTAIELGVFDIIAKAGEGTKLSPVEIAERMATNNHEAPIMLDRLLRVLASHSVLNCSVVSDGKKASKFQRLYSLGPVSQVFCD